jgi:hypothetical protein
MKKQFLIGGLYGDAPSSDWSVYIDQPIAAAGL